MTLNRRDALRLLGGAGFVAVVTACAGSSKRSSGAATSTTLPGTTPSTTPSTSAVTTTGTPIPEETAGPFPGDGSNGPNVLDMNGVVRRDITKSIGTASGVAAGIATTIKLSLVDTSNGNAPLSPAAVYVWHCDRDGLYSMYSDGATGENYLRGVQPAGADGVVEFDSIFPACYSGRWPHIHFEVYRSVDDATSSGQPIATSQIAIPQDACNTVYATDGYGQSVSNLSQLSLARDMVFGDDGGVRELGTVTGSPDEGYVIALTVPV